MTPLTKMLILDKWAAYHSKDWTRYSHLKSKVKSEVLKAKQIWAERLMKTSNGLWKLVKQQRQSQRDDFAYLGSDDYLLEEFSADLKDLFSQSSPSVDLNTNSLNDDNWSLDISEYTVWRKLSRYSKRKACGADNIPTRVYVELADVIAKPLTSIFNRSCVTRQLPEAWKKGLITPIPKTSPLEIKKSSVHNSPSPSKQNTRTTHSGQFEKYV